ncbi:MAG: EamA family transporter [Lachnospiraceae bacterium]|nr:EamA family transporter [Lachnospiraceae bacterium]
MEKKGVLCVLLAALLFGLMPITAKACYAHGVTPLFLTFLRFFLALPLLWILDKSTRKKSSNTINIGEAGKIIFLSLMLGLTAAFNFLAYDYIPSSLAMTLHFIYPVVVLALCGLIYRERLTTRQVLCCILCMVGIVAFCSHTGTIDLKGVLYAVLSGFTYGGYITYLSRSGLQQRTRPFQLMLIVQLVSSGIVLMMAIVKDAVKLDLDLVGWGLSALFAIGVTTATWLFMVGTKYCGPQTSALLSTLEPVVSIVIGVLALNEQLTIRYVYGIICILLATLLTIWMNNNNTTKAERKMVDSDNNK